jgi:uncharacterized protein YqfA (UPF0365 family)
MSVPSGLILFFLVLAIVVLAGIINYLFSFLQWYLAVNAGIKISLTQLFIMRRKGIAVNRILDNLVKAKHFNLPVSWEQLQKHHEKGGDLYNVMDGMVRGKMYGLNITFERAALADLQKINIPDGVEIIARHRGLHKQNVYPGNSNHTISPVFTAY